MCEFDHLQILHAQRMTGKRAATAECWRDVEGPVWMAPALQEICASLRWSLSTVVCPACLCGGCHWPSLSGHCCAMPCRATEEFREQGSYRLNDLKGRDLRRSVLTLGDLPPEAPSFITRVLHLVAGSGDWLPVILLFPQQCPNDPGRFVCHGYSGQPEGLLVEQFGGPDVRFLWFFLRDECA